MKSIIKKIISNFGYIIVSKHYFEKLGKQNSLYNSDIPSEGILYCERPEFGAKNLEVKLSRVAKGESFEWPNMVALNQAIACFIGDAKKIATIGCGTGTFETFASVDNSLSFVSSDFDTDVIKWCNENRAKNNITFCSLTIPQLIDKYAKFDLAVSADVIEHITDFAGFLNDFTKLADRAIITTPNKDRDLHSATLSTPDYEQHTKEWDAGEFYWILKCFYRNVELYAMPDLYVPKTQKIGLLSTMTPLIAICNR